MSMGYKELITFSGRGKTRLEVARLIIDALRANEHIGEFEYDPEVFREKKRHEICHHLPVDGKLAVVRGHLLMNRKYIFIAEKVSITHEGLTSYEEVISSLAPLSDRRIQHELSPEDIEIATTNLYRVIAGI